jgi:hypothetical protein
MFIFFLVLTIQCTQCIVLELIRANVLCIKEELYPGSLLIGNFTLSPFGRTINFNVCATNVQIQFPSWISSLDFRSGQESPAKSVQYWKGVILCHIDTNRRLYDLFFQQSNWERFALSLCWFRRNCFYLFRIKMTPPWKMSILKLHSA